MQSPGRGEPEPVWYQLTLQFPLLLVSIRHPKLHQNHVNQYKREEVFFLLRKCMVQNQAERTNTALYILAV